MEKPQGQDAHSKSNRRRCSLRSGVADVLTKTCVAQVPRCEAVRARCYSSLPLEMTTVSVLPESVASMTIPES